MREIDGRSGAEAPSGCQSSGPQPPSASSLSGIPNAGQWAVFRITSSFRPLDHYVRQIEKVTPKLLKFVGRQWPRQVDRELVVATLNDKTAAEHLCQAINGVAGTYNDRVRRASDDKVERVKAAREWADKTIARLAASGMSAEGQDAERLGAKPASPARSEAKGDAQSPTGDPQ